jgi:hypothetical protein
MCESAIYRHMHACQLLEGPPKPVAKAAIFRGKQGGRLADYEEIIVKLVN